MKITKYPQSCILITGYKGKNILTHYPEYRDEQVKFYNYVHETYDWMWHKRKIYSLPVEIEYKKIIKYFHKNKGNILKIDPNDYLKNCLDKLKEYYPKSFINGYNENISFEDGMSKCVTNFEEINGGLDLILDNSTKDFTNKINYIKNLLFKKLCTGGTYIINNVTEMELIDFFLRFNEQVTKKADIIACPFSLKETEIIKEINFINLGYKNVVIIQK